MKTRKGFVSNSSSSSFIVAFPKPIEEMSVEDVRQLMFGEQKNTEDVYGDDLFSMEQIAKVVRREATEHEPLNPFLEEARNKLIDEVDSGCFEAGLCKQQ